MSELNNIEGLVENPSNKIEETNELNNHIINHDHDDYEYDDDYYEIDFSKIMPEVYFIGEIPFHTIIEGITEQFNNYINTEDNTNYVSAFYQQLSDSYTLINDESNEYPQSNKEVLDRIHNIFTSHLVDLFDKRLFISITDLDNAEDDFEFIIQRSYEYFILNAKGNFKTVISATINGMIPEDVSDDEYFTQLQSLMEIFSPLITTITPVEFLQITGDVEIYNLFTNGKINGNFLRKYTPKLYQNDIYAVEVVNYTTMTRLFKAELKRPLTANESKILNLN